MEENLKTVRTAHRVLVIAAGILFIYGISITPYRNRYEEALTEFSQMDTAISRLIAIQETLLNKHIENSIYYDTVDRFLESYGYGDQNGRVVFEKNYGLRNIKKWPFTEIVNYFCSPMNWKVRAPKIDGSEMMQAKVYSMLVSLDSCMNSYSENDFRKNGIPLLGLYFSIFEDSATLTGVCEKIGVKVITIHGTDHAVNQSRILDSIDINFEDDEYTESELDATINDSVSNPAGSNQKVNDSIFDSLDYSDPGCPPQFELSYLQSVGDNHAYVQNIDESREIANYLETQDFIGAYDESGDYANSLPHIRSILPELKDLEYKDIPNFLKNKADMANETQRSYLEISGLRLPREVAGIGGPSILLIIFLELLSHLIQLNKIKDNHLSTIATFPWIGLHTNVFGQLMTFLSLTILVPVSCVLPITRSGYSVETRSWLVIVYILLFEILAAIALRKLYWIRKAHSPTE